MLQNPRGDGLPQLQLPADEYQHFHRVQIQEPIEPIQDIDEAYRRLDENETDAMANAFVGLEALQRAEESADQDNAIRYFDEAVQRLETAVRPGISLSENIAEHWYLLGRAFINMKEYDKAYEALQQAVNCNGRIPNIWVTVGILYYCTTQFHNALDALTRAIRLEPGLYVSWYNLGVLVRHH